MRYKHNLDDICLWLPDHREGNVLDRDDAHLLGSDVLLDQEVALALDDQLAVDYLRGLQLTYPLLIRQTLLLNGRLGGLELNLCSFYRVLGDGIKESDLDNAIREIVLAGVLLLHFVAVEVEDDVVLALLEGDVVFDRFIAFFSCYADVEPRFKHDIIITTALRPLFHHRRAILILLRVIQVELHLSLADLLLIVVDQMHRAEGHVLLP